MWVVNFVVMRDGERSQDDGSPRFLNPNAPFPVPDMDQTVLHRGEVFVVDDVLWDLERKTVFVEIVPEEEREQSTASAPDDGEINIEETGDSESDESEDEQLQPED